MTHELLIILGIVSGGLFSTILGDWERGLQTGIICGICTAVLMGLNMLPIWLVLVETMERST
jgi:hypothetical protein